MGNISVSLPSDGTTADVSDYNSPINTIVSEVNGNLDNNNIKAAAAIAGSKLASDSVTSTQIDFGGAGAGVWWEEIGRTTLTSTSDTISVSGLPARKYLRFMISTIATGGTTNQLLTFNADSGANYAHVRSNEFANIVSATSGNNLPIVVTAVSAPIYSVVDTTNIENQEKLVIHAATQRGSAGAGNVPTRRDMSGKWANTTDQITTITVSNTGTGDFAIGSEIIVLGHN